MNLYIHQYIVHRYINLIKKYTLIHIIIKQKEGRERKEEGYSEINRRGREERG